jgi:SAM-dependent methyltransferase
MNLEKILDLQKKPDPFTPGEPLFWNDPHISKHMLKAHLNPAHDLASRRPETIDRSVDWLVKSLNIPQAAQVLDLGCGPGLYAERFARRGFHVTGVDYSRRSIDYAKQAAQQQGLSIHYRCQDYLNLEEENQYDLALLIYGDFCPLSPDQRSRLLMNVSRALKPGGYFVLDVSTREHRTKHGMKNGWYAEEDGFWKPGLHLVLEQGFDYPEQDIYLDQAVVIEETGKITVYRMWFQDYNPQSISKELEGRGFTIESLWSDLCGAHLEPDTEWIGVISHK